MFIIKMCRKQLVKLAVALVLVFPTISSASLISMQTVLGTIDIQLFDTDAPQTVANFMNYVNSGAYNNTFIHRSVPGFVIQGGGYAWDPISHSAPHITTSAPITNEFSTTRSNLRGTIAMAKVGTDPNSATSEWFINLADNSANLDFQNGGFTVFGQVSINGMQVIDAIAALQRVNAGSPFDSLPLVNPYDSASGWQATNFVTVNSVAAVPLPAAAWLFGSGLIGLVGVVRKRKIA
jgi:peptidyl-prolyl cis-trans isomerase A (cyclophilin A)